VFISVNFPLVDIRRCLNGSDALLSKPSWPAPLADQDFVRGFGLTRKRPQGGIEGWVGENTVCEANRPFRIENPAIALEEIENTLEVKITYKRLYFDGLCSGYFSIGFSIKNKQISSLHDLTGLVEAILLLPASVRNPGSSQRTTNLLQSRTDLAAAYQRNTVAHESNQKINSRHVSLGKPVLFIEKDPRIAGMRVCKRQIEIDKTDGFSMTFSENRVAGLDIPIWACASETLQGRQRARGARICISRIYAGYHSLLFVLQQIGNKSIPITKGSKGTEFLQHFLNKSISFLIKKDSDLAARTNSEIIQYSHRIFESSEPGFLSSVTNAIENSCVELNHQDIRLNIRRKVENFCEQNAKNLIVNYNYGKSKIMGNGDTFINQDSVVGSQGANSRGSVNAENFNNTSEAGTHEFLALASELKEIRLALVENDNSASAAQKAAVLAEAEEAASQGEGHKATAILMDAADWCLDIAKQLGKELVMGVLKDTLKLP